MPLAITLFPDVDRVEDLIEASMPWFSLWLVGLALVLVAIAIKRGVGRLRCRSPVAQLLRRQF